MEQNLLKLFGALINNHIQSIPLLPEPKENEGSIIY